MIYKINWYWKKEPHNQIMIFSTCKIVHPCLDSTVVKDIGKKITANITHIYH